MKIPLFDIDGTLLKSGAGSKAHRQAFDAAFTEIYGVTASVDEIVTHGKIDKQIILEVLDLHDISEEAAKQKIDAAIEFMVVYFNEHANPVESVPEIGVDQTLLQLHRLGLPLGLLTGNIKRIAHQKLRNADLVHYFSFGAFGDQAWRRVDLVSLALAELRQQSDEGIQLTDLVIVGDTPLDITCAIDAGIESVGVVTDNYSKKELQDAGASLVIENMQDDRSIIIDYFGRAV